MSPILPSDHTEPAKKLCKRMVEVSPVKMKALPGPDAESICCHLVESWATLNESISYIELSMILCNTGRDFCRSNRRSYVRSWLPTPKMTENSVYNSSVYVVLLWTWCSLRQVNCYIQSRCTWAFAIEINHAFSHKLVAKGKPPFCPPHEQHSSFPHATDITPWYWCCLSLKKKWSQNGSTLELF